MREKNLTGYPSIDKPWLKYYDPKDIDTPLPECTMYELIFNRNQDNLLHTAISYYGTDISYEQMFHEIDLLAGTLEYFGVKKGEIVTICMINSPETIYLLFALNKIGAVANMVYTSSTPEELKKSIQDAKSTLVFTLDIFQDKFLEIADSVNLQRIVVTNLARSISPSERSATGGEQKALPDDIRFLIWEKFFCSSRTSSRTYYDVDAPAVITYTGGTTGGAKGAVLSNRAAVAFALQYAIGEPNLHRNSTWVQILPLFIAYGVSGSLMIPLMVGMTLIVRLPLAESITELCEKFHPNHIMFSPAYWENFVDDNKDFDLSNLIAPITGGDILRPALEKKINQYLERQGCTYPILNGYGLTEVGAGCTVNYLHAHKAGSVGIPFVKNIVSAFDIDTGKELPYEKEGEICINTPSVMIGYINNATETANILRRHDDGMLWVHTGDIGYVSEDGFVTISGRLKRYLVCVSEGVHKKVFSLDIERVLLKYPCVEKCAVVPIANDETIQAPVAFIVLSRGYKASLELENELRLHCEKNLQKIYRPAQYRFVDKFPLTKVGKVDYLALEKALN